MTVIANPISQYKMNDIAGTAVVESISAANGVYTEGVAAATVNSVTGQLPASDPKALSFNGTDEYVVLTAAQIYNTTTGYSVCAWVKAVAAANKTVYSEGNSGDADPHLNVKSGNVGNAKLNIFLKNDAGGTLINNVESTADAFDNAWHFIAFTDNLGTYRLYVDGSDSGGGTYTPAAVTVNISTIGVLRRTTRQDYFPGAIDNVLVFDRALTPSEILVLWNDGAGTEGFGTTDVAGGRLRGRYKGSYRSRYK